ARAAGLPLHDVGGFGGSDYSLCLRSERRRGLRRELHAESGPHRVSGELQRERRGPAVVPGEPRDCWPAARRLPGCTEEIASSIGPLRMIRGGLYLAHQLTNSP